MMTLPFDLLQVGAWFIYDETVHVKTSEETAVQLTVKALHGRFPSKQYVSLIQPDALRYTHESKEKTIVIKSVS